MAPRILRPLSYGDLFDEVFDLYKKHFVLFVGITAVVNIPVYALVYAFAGAFASTIASILSIIFTYVALAATTWAVSQCYLNKEASITKSYKAVGHTLVVFVLTMLGAILRIYCGFLLVIPGVILLFRYAFVSEVYIIEGLRGKEARARSAQLAKGNESRIFVVGLVSGILAGIVSLIITTPVQFAIGGFSHHTYAMGGLTSLLFGVVAGIAGAVTTPIQILAFVLLYYDIRVRKEGFDIEMLTASMGGSIEPTPAVPDEVKQI